ncbi:hypothetical protein CSKR_100281 [Clonorchis sinensis]|uniref:Uncharacterized protein n=2 Tax=Clonorchis sinensis TaxID=79923 RepID=H2KNJ3_CLOSI|nr:hypothetical protein CSKR_100281 [Clonorchis sinensis]GAA33346.2 hypothetical protein CLF_100278 [Clonorchis sinensis]
MSSASLSIFPLTYLGNSVLQETGGDELETIYELLLSYYLDFLCKVSSRSKHLRSYADVMSRAYPTVVMTVGNGQFSLRFIGTEKCGDQTFRKHLEKNFNPEELVYFNCYYFEVVTPMGRNKNKCFAYFRRVVDTRRCVPEDALFELDDRLSGWLLMNRHIPRPPLVYCIVSTKKLGSGLVCYAFLADNVQEGLRTLRCLSELRQFVAQNVPKFDGAQEVPYNYVQNFSGRSSRERVEYSRRASRLHPKAAHPKRSRSNDPHMNRWSRQTCTECCSDASKYFSDVIRMPPNLCRSHANLIHQSEESPSCILCERAYCSLCGEIIDSDSSTPESETKRNRRIQRRLGREALDYYRRRRQQMSLDRDRPRRVHQCISDGVEYRLEKMEIRDPSTQQHAYRLSKTLGSSLPEVSKPVFLDRIHPKNSPTTAVQRPRPSGSASSRRQQAFLDSSLAMLP